VADQQLRHWGLEAAGCGAENVGDLAQEDVVRAYVIVTSALFALLTVVHVVRMFAEPQLVREPWFLGVTAVSLGLTVWAVRVAARGANP